MHILASSKIRCSQARGLGFHFAPLIYISRLAQQLLPSDDRCFVVQSKSAGLFLVPFSRFFWLFQAFWYFTQIRGIICLSFAKNTAGSLIGIALNRIISRSSFSFIDFPDQYHGISLYLLAFSLIFTSVLQFSLYRSHFFFIDIFSAFYLLIVRRMDIVSSFSHY